MRATGLAAWVLGLGFGAEPVGAQALAQHHLFTELGDNTSDFLGASVAGAGDVDGDGYDDVIVGADQDFPQTGIQVGPGYARVYSGRNGLAIYHLEGDAWKDQFGHSVSGAGDVNADGFDDLVVGAPQINPIPGPTGYCRIFSGKTGNTLWTFTGQPGHKGFGYGVAAVGDLNGDGFDDVLIGPYGVSNSSLGVVRAYSGEWIASMSQGLVPATPEFLYEAHKEDGGGFGAVTLAAVGFVDADTVPDFAVGSPFGAGYIQVHSGADGSLLWSVTNPSGDSFDDFGVSLAGVGDVNGDGHDDVAVGARLDDTQGTNAGAVWVFSGSGGANLATIFGDSANDWFGQSVTGAGDLNRDGFADLAIGSPPDGVSQEGAIRVFSGEWITSTAFGRTPTTPEVLLQVNGENAGDLFGSTAAFAGDVNADLVPDLVVGATLYDAPGTGSSGAAYVVSGAALSLASMDHKVSLSTGGAHDLTLDAPDTRAGDFYVVLGSISGTKPGVLIGGLPLPLNPDPYTRVAASLANVPPFVSFAGVLDAEGDATARFELPPGMDPALAGLTLDHAFVTVSLLPFPAFTFASNPVPVSLVP